MNRADCIATHIEANANGEIEPLKLAREEEAQFHCLAAFLLHAAVDRSSSSSSSPSSSDGAPAAGVAGVASRSTVDSLVDDIATGRVDVARALAHIDAALVIRLMHEYQQKELHSASAASASMSASASASGALERDRPMSRREADSSEHHQQIQTAQEDQPMA